MNRMASTRTRWCFVLTTPFRAKQISSSARPTIRSAKPIWGHFRVHALSDRAAAPGQAGFVMVMEPDERAFAHHHQRIHLHLESPHPGGRHHRRNRHRRLRSRQTRLHVQGALSGLQPARRVSALQPRFRFVHLEPVVHRLAERGRDVCHAITDNVAYNRGAHTFKFGGLWNRNDNGQQPTRTDGAQHQLRAQHREPGRHRQYFRQPACGQLHPTSANPAAASTATSSTCRTHGR